MQLLSKCKPKSHGGSDTTWGSGGVLIFRYRRYLKKTKMSLLIYCVYQIHVKLRNALSEDKFPSVKGEALNMV